LNDADCRGKWTNGIIGSESRAGLVESQQVPASLQRLCEKPLTLANSRQKRISEEKESYTNSLRRRSALKISPELFRIIS
jgi:hypothetical protein